MATLGCFLLLVPSIARTDEIEEMLDGLSPEADAKATEAIVHAASELKQLLQNPCLGTHSTAEQELARCNAVIALAPELAAAYRDRAHAYIRNGRFDEALSDLSKAIALLPGDAANYRTQGLAYEVMNKYEAAHDSYTKAITVAQAKAGAYLARARVRALQKDREGALEDLARARQLAPNAPGLERERVMIIAETGDDAEKLEAARQAVVDAPHEATNYLTLGDCLVEAGEYSEAAEVYQKGLKLHREDWSMCRQFAQLLATCEEKDVRNGQLALKLAQEACETTGYRYPDVLETLAASHAECGQFAEALKWQREALRLSGDLPRVLQQAMRQTLELYKQGKPLRLRRGGRMIHHRESMDSDAASHAEPR
jgi:tetratricopeptide (TPR) repeat protein